MKILAVTVLTCLDEGDIRDLGFNKEMIGNEVTIKQLVLSRARRALEVGCDGVISSGLEAPDIRNELGEKILIVALGIRPVKNTDDQKRTVNIEEAFENGADYIVIGRPIRQSENPKTEAESAQKKIRDIFS